MCMLQRDNQHTGYKRSRWDILMDISFLNVYVTEGYKKLNRFEKRKKDEKESKKETVKSSQIDRGRKRKKEN